MAIEWYVDGGHPVGAQDIVERSREFMDEILDSSTEVHPTSLGGDLDLHVPQFVAQIDVWLSGLRCSVTVDSDWLVETDGQARSGLIFGSVTAERTRLSVCCGTLVALAWATLSSGDLWGTGLFDRAWHSGDLVDLRQRLKSDGSRSGLSQVDRISEIQGASTLPFS